ncbi:MAG: malto-oligosyltrehalose synthase [Betaproteobacteria bacterium]
MNEALVRLAERHGIAPTYHDIWGMLHLVSESSLIALLGAMGVDACDAAHVDEALRAAADDDARRAIAPMVVLRADNDVRQLTFHLPQVPSDATLTVRVLSADTAERVPPALATLMSRPDAASVSPDAIGDVPGVSGPASTAQPPPTLRVEVTLAPSLPHGYYDIEICHDAVYVARTRCALVPPRCYLPADATALRMWGPAVQLYGVRSQRNWGIGDLGDVATLAEQWGARGADVVGLNPLHALFPEQPLRASPYSPSSRLFRNTLYLDVEAIDEFRECVDARAEVASDAFQGQLTALRAAPLVDYVGVAAVKATVFALLYRCFRGTHLAADDARAAEFRAFVEGGGRALREFTLFQALQEALHADDPAVWGWPAWPERYRDPSSAAVVAFAAAQRERIEYFMYLQWQAELQFAAAAESARTAGMRVGLYTDLAVSVDPGGAESWAQQGLYARGASAGAPPDAFNVSGQDWGLPPLVPTRLVADGYAPFLATLRANMRDAGALRIDHVMGLARLYWVPAGGRAADGAYIHYPFEALLGLLALESHRHRCIVIGEDLGTVPDDVRDALARHGVLSYRVLIFEREGDGAFKPPDAYPAQALVTSSTHDLPTIAGWWAGSDITLRTAQGLVGSAADADAQRRERGADRDRLLDALHRAGQAVDVQPGGHDLAFTAPPADAMQRFLSMSPALLQMIQLEDLVGVVEQANLPGTTDTYPNWRRKLPLRLEHWAGDWRFDALTDAIAAARPRPAASLPRLDAPFVPRATYRVQLNHAFTFADATALVPYLAALGVSHVYCSPYLRARPGSLHGYDIVDHGTLNPEIGSRADFERFVAALDAHGMGHVCDVVPNHVGVMGSDNRWWMDVLENGPSSAFADYFDIDWTPLDPAFAGRVVVPVLGAPYGTVLARGQLRLAFEPAEGSFAIRYFEHRFPLDMRSCATLVADALAIGGATLSPDTVAAATAALDAMRALPPRDATGDARIERQREVARCKDRLALLATRQLAFAEAIEQAVDACIGMPGVDGGFDALHALIEQQAFRLAYWRVAADEINYRRFFDVNDLAALRMEHDAVFDATHRLILSLAAAGKIHGLRIDHPDGLRDPARYLERLQARYREYAAAMRAQDPATVPPLYVVLEKIAASHERMPAQWPVSGSTGYRFANLVNGLFVDRTAKASLDRAWRAFVGAEAAEFDATVIRSKLAIMRGTLSAELTMISNRALRIARGDRNTRDFTLNLLRETIEDIVARFPVYRTYVDANGASAQDLRYIDWAVARARRESRSADTSVFDFLRGLMLGELPGADATRAAQARDFAMRFQQFTSPVAAKGVEDTSFYRFNRLVSLNDVGGNPDEFGISRRGFHGASRVRASTWPSTLLATSTHDNKRSGDVRARIDLLSEWPAAWRLAVRRWSRMNRSRKRTIDGRDAPSRSDEYLLYQTLVGTFPANAIDDAARERYTERIVAYMIKAAREAKVRTSWFAIDADYEDALSAFVRALLASGEQNLFDEDLRRQTAHFAWYGRLNSVSMALLKFASPGVPDIYQGTELVDLRLVDPDNRVAVDYAARRAVLDQCLALDALSPAERGAAFADWFADLDDGRPKMWVTQRLLALRATAGSALVSGDYKPLEARGAHARHVIAFARRAGDHAVIAVAGRLFASLGRGVGELPLGEEAWGNTTLKAAFLPQNAVASNVLTGERIDVGGGSLLLARLFHRFPGAVLHVAPPA